MGKRTSTWIWAVFAGAITLAAHAEERQPLEDLTAVAAAFLEQEIFAHDAAPEISVGHIDSRLRLPKCTDPIAGFLPPGSARAGNITVGIRCDGVKRRSIYVTAQVKLMRPVLVLGNPVGRGQVIRESDLRLEPRDVGRLNGGYIGDPRDVVGLEARMPLRAGFVLSSKVLMSPKLVRRGQTVTLLAQSQGFEVRSAGRALQDGVAGEQISVENLGSNRIIQGIVAESGLVQVRM